MWVESSRYQTRLLRRIRQKRVAAILHVSFLRLNMRIERGHPGGRQDLGKRCPRRIHQRIPLSEKRSGLPIGPIQRRCGAIVVSYQRVVLRLEASQGIRSGEYVFRGETEILKVEVLVFAFDLLPKIRAEVYMNIAYCGEEEAWQRGSIAKWR